MSAIGSGDFVECAPAPGYRGEVPRELVKVLGLYPERGGIYQVREVGHYGAGGINPGLRLVGIIASIPGHPDAWWPAEQFRPIYSPKQSLIEDLKRPVELPADVQWEPA